MPLADTRRRGAARTLGARLLRRGGAAACALALAAVLALALAPGIAAAKSKGGSHSHHSSQDDNDHGGNNDQGSPGAANNSSPGNGGNDSGAGAGGGPSSGGSANAGTASGGNGQRATGGFDTNLFYPRADQPSLGFGFNNDGASIQARIPLGVSHPSAAPANDHLGHPLVSMPFGHAGGPAALAPAFAHPMAYGATPHSLGGSLGGGNPLTTKLIHSVAGSLTDKFASKLGHSLRAHTGEHGDTSATTTNGTGGGNDVASKLIPARKAAEAAASRSPAAVVNDRFGGIGVEALEPRVFTVPALGETRFVPNEIVVGVPASVSPQQLAAVARRNGLTPVDNRVVASSGLTLQRWRVADRRPLADVIRGLQAEADVRTAQPNFRFKLAQAAGFSEAAADGFSVQYAPAKLHLAQAHRLSVGQGVLVAVIDTGIDRLHPEIAGAIAASFDAIGAREPPDAHGTAIAGAIVSHGRLMGAAPGARLLAIRAFSTAGPDAEATTMTVVRSVEWAMAQGARVINMSFAGARDPVIGRSLALARRKGIVLVAAAGNAGPNSPPLYPAADPNVIAVSATDVDDRLLDVANRGRQIALTAPGVDVLLPAPGARYQIATGTSFAAAHVAGIAALLIARNPQLAPEQVRGILVSTARDLGPKGRDDQFGAGLADAYKAVASVASGTSQTVASAAPNVP